MQATLTKPLAVTVPPRVPFERKQVIASPRGELGMLRRVRLNKAKSSAKSRLPYPPAAEGRRERGCRE